MLEVLRAVTGQQPASQDGPERVRLDIGTRPDGELLGDDVGELTRDATLLDREGRAVSCGEDVGDARHTPAIVDEDEAALVGRHTGNLGPADGRQRDDAFGIQPFAPGRSSRTPLAVARA